MGDDSEHIRVQLSEDSFYHGPHKEIFNALDGNTDVIKLMDKLPAHTEIIKEIATYRYVGKVQYMVDTLKEYTVNRELYTRYIQAKELLANYSGYELKTKLLEHFDIKIDGTQEIGWDAQVDTAIQHIQARQGKAKQYKIGLADLDKKLNIENDSLIVVGARSSMGKTAFAINVICNMAKQGLKTAFFSLETGSLGIIKRILAYQEGISISRMNNNNLTESEIKQLTNNKIKQLNMRLYENIYDIDKIVNKTRELKQRYGLDCIVIDHIQEVVCRGQHNTTNDRITAIGNKARIISKEIKVPTICVSQLSRAVEGRGDHRPILSDLRDSGSLEQLADIVLLLYRDSYYNKESVAPVNDVIEVNIAKQRDGEAGGWIEVGCQLDKMKIYDISDKEFKEVKSVGSPFEIRGE